MSGVTQIYVALLDEGVDVWRPVRAKRLGGNTFLIVDESYDRETESWQFEPGEKVVCEEIASHEGTILAATRRAEDRDKHS